MTVHIANASEIRPLRNLVLRPNLPIETTFYDENNNNQVWSHLWQFWEGTSKRNGETIRGPVNASFKWVDGKIIRALYIYDSVPISTEIAAVQKK